MDIRERRVVARFAESRVVRHDDTELVGPRFGKLKAIYSPPTVEQHQSLALAGSVHDSLDAVDCKFLARELAHCAPPGRRSRGMTSSANKVMFFTAFQCGISATCSTLLMWLVPIRVVHSPI